MRKSQKEHHRVSGKDEVVAAGVLAGAEEDNRVPGGSEEEMEW